MESLVLQERDLALLRALFESRIMTAVHVAEIFFEGRAEATKKRLQKLKAATLIGERPRRAYEPAVLYLSRAGLALLKERGDLNDYPSLSLPSLEKRSQVSQLTIRHELSVMDVKSAFHRALRGHATFSIAEFGTWPRLYQFEATAASGEETVVRPDGFIRIHEREAGDGLSEHSLFLEVDRSSETLDVLVSRAYAYLDYYKSGGFAERCGGTRSAVKDYPFRVLMVFKTAERRNNMAERLLTGVPPILTQVCLATIAEVTADPLGEIWVRPADYREAVGGTEHENPTNRWGYKRQVARDVSVEKRIKRVALLV